MTVITPASEHLNGDDFDPRKDAQLRRRILEEQQNQAALQRVAERAEPRLQHEEALASPCSIAEANPPEHIAQRLDRLTRYYAGDKLPETTPTAAPDELLAQAIERAPIAVPQTTPPDELFEAIIGTYDVVGTRYLDAGVAAARAVGRILIKDDRGRLVGYGTGSMISPSLMLTNHHVFDNPLTAATSHVEFDYQDGIDGNLLKVTTFGFDPDRFFLADEALDFAIVAVRAGVEELAQFGFNRLIESAGKSLVGEFVTIVQHPRGEKKQVALRENRIVDNLDRFVHYSADTEPGSSGSPVFNDQWEVIALHHASVRAPEHTEFGGVLNEGIRVSAIVRTVKARPLSAEQRTLADMILHPPTQERKPCPASGVPTVSGSPISIKIPLTLDLTLPPGVAAQLRFEQPPKEPPEPEEPEEPEEPASPESVDPDYGTRRGYDPAFLAVPLPLPTPKAGADLASPPLPYHHFSVVMHRRRKLAMFAAVNIDGGKADQPRRDRDVWLLDPRIPAGEQTGEAVYRDNDLDRGHLVRRLDPAWGPQSAAAVDDTFHFTNCAPQHHEFNAGRTLWLGLEDYVLHNALTSDLKVSVFSGPVLDDGDPSYRGVALPLQYWKIVAMVRTDGKPSVTAYLLSQSALLDEYRTERTPGALPESFSYGAYRTFQVPVRRIAELSGLDLTSYIAADPLERLETTRLPRELVQHDHILL